MNIEKNEVQNKLNEENLEQVSGGSLANTDGGYIPIPIPRPPKAPARQNKGPLEIDDPNAPGGPFRH